MSLYDFALTHVSDVLRSLATAGLRTPIAAQLEAAVRVAARAAVRDSIPLAVVSADLGRLVAEAMLGDPHAVDVGRAMARRAAREYHGESDG
jgi:Mg-chelatase subunit ChlD